VSVQPITPPGRLLTVAEYLAIGEVEPGYTELVEGRLLVSPSPVPDHSHASTALWAVVSRRLQPGFEALLDLDVDLQLVADDAPGTVRRPDLVVVSREVRRRIRREGGTIRAAEVLLAVEIVSPGSRRMDNVMKRVEYADAGIPHYWAVDLDEPVSVLACHLGAELGYVDGGAVTGTFRTTEPFPVEIDLAALLD
jgi:Uma2 family endonuclease